MRVGSPFIAFHHRENGEAEVDNSGERKLDLPNLLDRCGDIECAACPIRLGAMERRGQKWLHTLCKLLLGSEEAPNGLGKPCEVCAQRTGRTKLCDLADCDRRFHSVCARNNGNLMAREGEQLRQFCDRHTEVVKEVLERVVARKEEALILAKEARSVLEKARDGLERSLDAFMRDAENPDRVLSGLMNGQREEPIAGRTRSRTQE